jgi:hypothetical protein
MDAKQCACKRVVLAELDYITPPTFWGLLTLPDGMVLDDIRPLYRQWRKLTLSDACGIDFPDWLLSEHGFVEEDKAVGYYWLDPEKEKDDEE